ncbi:hypothetical protein LTS18_012644, partial [Coniosporium uncinatum]
MENEVLARLENEIRSNEAGTLLPTIVLVNMAAEYRVVERIQEEEDITKPMKSRELLSRLNVKTFLVLLRLLRDELRAAGEDTSISSSRSAGDLFEKTFTTAKSILPALRNYSSWFIINRKVLALELGNPVIDELTSQLWDAYAATMNALLRSFPIETLAEAVPPTSVMLPEDMESLGFRPLQDDAVRSRWYTDGQLKPKYFSSHGKQPTAETMMLMRVRALMEDAAAMVQDEAAPINFNGTCFEHTRADSSAQGSFDPTSELPNCIPTAEPLQPRPVNEAANGASSSNPKTTTMPSTPPNKTAEPTKPAPETISLITLENQPIQSASLPVTVNDYIDRAMNKGEGVRRTSGQSPPGYQNSSTSLAYLPSLPGQSSIWGPAHAGSNP